MGEGPILVVDDDPVVRTVVQSVLAQAGFRAVAAADGLEALRLFRQHAPAFVILDILLPKLDGSTVLQRLRAESDVPVLMLTARSRVGDRVRELGHGADDYLVKPFAAAELVARVRAILRRTRRGPAAPAVLRHAGIELDPGARTVSARGQPVLLTPAQFRILQALMEHPGRVCTRAGLLDRLYANGEKEVLERTVDAHVAALRRKLRQAGADVIVTVRGAGYKLGGA